MVDLQERLSAAAYEQGFILVGFAALRPLERKQFFHRWLEDGCHGEMSYLSREPQKRLDPRLLDPRLRSVISLGYPYQAPRPAPVDWRQALRGRIAAYALGEDYHTYVLAKARRVVEALRALRPQVLTRVYVDTGPVLEREWAFKAGIGWLGKNTNLLNRRYGSYFFLAEIFTDLDFGTESPAYGAHCGRCRRCIELCPTQALKDGYVMDARLCISYLTIELRGPIPIPLRPKIGNWIFGCDICQDVCPWNDESNDSGEWQLTPYLPELLALDQDQFSRRFARSAIKRAKRRGLLRNVAVALGNSGNPRAVPVLAACLEREPEPLVRAHAAWALGCLGGNMSRRTLERCLSSEPDPAVAQEITLALACDGASELKSV
jgi:epoxyqueuosine reductase